MRGTKWQSTIPFGDLRNCEEYAPPATMSGRLTGRMLGLHTCRHLTQPTAPPFPRSLPFNHPSFFFLRDAEKISGHLTIAWPFLGQTQKTFTLSGLLVQIKPHDKIRSRQTGPRTIGPNIIGFLGPIVLWTSGARKVGPWGPIVCLEKMDN